MKIFLKITETSGQVTHRAIRNHNMIAHIMEAYQTLSCVKSVELELK